MAQNEPAAPGNTRTPETVLLTRFSALGDVAMTIPVIYSACAAYPDIRFVLLTRPAMTAMFVGAPANLTLRGVDLKEQYKGIGGMRRLASDVVAEYRPDVLLDLHNVLRTKLLAFFLWLKGVPSHRIFKPRAKRRELTRPSNKVMLPLTSQRARYREVFYKAGLPVNDTFAGLYRGRGASDPADFAAITGPKPEGAVWIGIAPFAAHQGKIYPPELMEQVVARLQGHADENGIDMTVFLLGGGGEEQTVLEGWEKRYAVARSLAGKHYGFAAELALFNHLDALLSMDSANMHLGAIALAPTLSIWGATHPYCGFKGWHQRDADTIQLPLSCRPCSVYGDKPCHRGDYLCLRGIKPEAVAQRILEKLK